MRSAEPAIARAGEALEINAAFDRPWVEAVVGSLLARGDVTSDRGTDALLQPCALVVEAADISAQVGASEVSIGGLLPLQVVS